MRSSSYLENWLTEKHAQLNDPGPFSPQHCMTGEGVQNWTIQRVAWLVDTLFLEQITFTQKVFRVRVDLLTVKLICAHRNWFVKLLCLHTSQSAKILVLNKNLFAKLFIRKDARNTSINWWHLLNILSNNWTNDIMVIFTTHYCHLCSAWKAVGFFST